MNQLDQLKQHTIVVADTGDFESMRAYTPRDATTNPSLILKAVQQAAYRPLLDRVLSQNRHLPLDAIVDRLLVAIVPGRVSTEVDARLSFDIAATVARARELIGLYEGAGVPRERVLIKIAATWEGIRAAEILEREGIHCNLTLLFSLVQAVACAEAGVTLISPFVGRITDWYQKSTGTADYAPADDPGVRSVQSIYAYFKVLSYPTQVMGASFRNSGQILQLAGCDLLTIAPQLLAELQQADAPVPARLTPAWAATQNVEPLLLNESSFRWKLNEDAMATEKLAEGIRVFASDALKLEHLLQN